MTRNRQKPVGRDKGSLTEQQTEGNRNNNGTKKEKTYQRTARSRQPLSRNRTGAARSRAASEFPAAPLPPLEPSVTSQGMEHRALARWGQAPPPGCAPSWSPVKINPVLAKPRTNIYSPSPEIRSSAVQIMNTSEQANKPAINVQELSNGED